MKYSFQEWFNKCLEIGNKSTGWNYFSNGANYFAGDWSNCYVQIVSQYLLVKVQPIRENDGILWTFKPKVYNLNGEYLGKLPKRYINQPHQIIQNFLQSKFPQ